MCKYLIGDNLRLQLFSEVNHHNVCKKDLLNCHLKLFRSTVPLPRVPLIFYISTVYCHTHKTIKKNYSSRKRSWRTLKRSSPTGGCAYGIPRKERNSRPLKDDILDPRTRPRAGIVTVGSNDLLITIPQ